MLTTEVLEFLDRSVLGWLATVSTDGTPNVSPKEVFASFGTRMVLVANIASPTSLRNIRMNPAVCFSFVEVFVQKGFKLKGTARIVERSDPDFAELSHPLETMTQGVFRIHHVFAITVTDVEPIIAPSYRYRPHVTEQDQIVSAMQSYRVRPDDSTLP